MEGLRWRFHAKRLVGPAVIVEVDSVSNRSCCMLKAFEAMPMDALLFQRTNDAFDRPVLLRTVRRNELLFKTITSDELSECQTGKNKAIIGPQQKGAFDLAEGSITSNQSLFKSCARR